MAIADVAEYAHLSDADLEGFGLALEEIRRDIEESRGEKDSSYDQHRWGRFGGAQPDGLQDVLHLWQLPHFIQGDFHVVIDVFVTPRN
jgi:hypothetical protein